MIYENISLGISLAIYLNFNTVYPTQLNQILEDLHPYIIHTTSITTLK